MVYRAGHVFSIDTDEIRTERETFRTTYERWKLGKISEEEFWDAHQRVADLVNAHADDLSRGELSRARVVDFYNPHPVRDGDSQ